MDNVPLRHGEPPGRAWRSSRSAHSIPRILSRQTLLVGVLVGERHMAGSYRPQVQLPGTRVCEMVARAAAKSCSNSVEDCTPTTTAGTFEPTPLPAKGTGCSHDQDLVVYVFGESRKSVGHVCQSQGIWGFVSNVSGDGCPCAPGDNRGRARTKTAVTCQCTDVQPQWVLDGGACHRRSPSTRSKSAQVLLLYVVDLPVD
jgi:hypothetical protein